MGLARNIAVVGCGYWGQNLVRSAAELGVLAAVSDVDPARAEKFATQYNVPALSFDDILANADVTGVMLPVPAPLHAKMTLQALDAGKHVFVEKPIAMTLKDAEAMVKRAKAQGRVLMVGHVLQYHPAFTALKKLIAEGELGQLRRIYSNRLNFGKVRTEENVLWSFAPHDVSMVLALAGREPLTIAAEYSADVPQSQIASTALVHFEFGRGLTGHIHVSWFNPFKEQKLVVIGEHAMAVFDDTLGWDAKLMLYKNRVLYDDHHQPVLHREDAVAVALVESPPLRNEIAHFAHCMETGQTPDTDGLEAARVLKVMQACDKAAGL